MSARKLTEQEELAWEKATIQGAMKAPVFTDALSMTIPYHSDDVGIACIDEHWRLALGDGFFSLTRKQQAFVACHEACHVLNLHFSRAAAAHQTDGPASRLSQDIEIDQQFAGIEGLDMPPMYPMPDDYGVPRFKAMEEYYPAIHGNGEGDGPDGTGQPSGKQDGGGNGAGNAGTGAQSPGSPSSRPEDGSTTGSDGDAGSDADGNGSQPDGEKNGGTDAGGDGGDASRKTDGGGRRSHARNAKRETKAKPRGCADDDPVRMSHEADDAGIERLSTAGIANTMKATQRRAAAQAKKYGKGSANGCIADWLDAGMRPPKADWRDILRHVVSDVKTVKSYQATDRSFMKVNKRAAAFMPDVVMPGYTSFAPQVMMALDTSGSMSSDEIHAALMEAQGVIDSGLGKGSFKAFCVDTEMKKVQPVDDISRLDITGRGGTDMMPAFRYIKGLPMHDRPDLFMLATDGFVPWDSCRRWLPDWQCTVVLLITSEDGMKQIPGWMKDAGTVICIAPDGRTGAGTPHGFGNRR